MTKNASLIALTSCLIALSTFAPRAFAEDEIPPAETPATPKLQDTTSDIQKAGAQTPMVTPTPMALQPTATPRAVANPIYVKESPRENEDAYGKPYGLLGPVTFGPSVTLLSIPHPFEAGVELKYRNLFGLAFTYGLLPQIKISSTEIKMHSFDVRARWFPFGGAFFLGIGYGSHTLDATRSDSTDGIDYNVTGELKAKYWLPEIGWRWEWHSGFFFGMDLGAQINSNANTVVSSDHPELDSGSTQSDYESTVSSVQTKANDFGDKTLPWITLIHFGFLF